jgi:large subunit ribosomal protein L21
VVFKHKRRKDYRKKQGHRQAYTAVLIESIQKHGQEDLQPDAQQQEAEA